MNFPALEQALREAGLTALPETALSRFQIYLDLLLKWNSRLNLTAIRHRDSILHRHFVECIQCAQALPVESAGATLLDFGSGAGLPGIPISICRPEIWVTLAESQRKKAAFLKESVRSLSLNAEVFDGRVEDMSPERRFDIVTLRAVDRMGEACRGGMERVSRRGQIIIFTTQSSEAAIKSMLPELQWNSDLHTPGLERGIVMMGTRPV